MLPSSFYCGTLSFGSYVKQKGSKCVILKPQTSLESESFLAYCVIEAFLAVAVQIEIFQQMPGKRINVM